MRLSLVALSIVAAGLLIGGGCNGNASLFSDEFRSLSSGNVVPLVPGQPSQLILVRLVNDTEDAIEFVVTAERQLLVSDAEGNTVIEKDAETVRLRSFPFESISEVGALFDCEVTRLGLGEDIDRPFTDPGLFVLEGVTDPTDVDAAITTGVGVPSNLPPLDSVAGNFVCGDTVVFRVIEQQGAVGNLQVQSYVLPWTSQPTEFSGPHTFNNVRNFLEEQIAEE